jgi:predicted nucleic acid-binding protein
VIVIDASALVEALLEGPGGRAAGRLLGSGERLQAPHLIDVEVAQVIRRIQADGRMDLRRAEQAIEDLAEFPLARRPHTLLLPRIWELRSNLTAYDAVYVALAEALDAPLITRDARLARAPGHRAKVELV